jgi:arsenite/tail-anchored protein-transporting ATPase
VVDCAPTGETLRLLALPEALAWYVDRVFPVERRLARTLRPLLGRAGAASVPHDHVVTALERLHADLKDVRALLTRSEAGVRLVLTPESLVLAEARRTYTSLSLYGYRVDGVVVNKVMPPGGEDAWRQAWVSVQRRELDEVRSSFHPLPVYEAPYQPGEPVGADELAALAAGTYGTGDPLGPAGGPAEADTMTVRSDGDAYVLSVPLPFAQRGDVELTRRADDLAVTVGVFRRVVSLPSVLRRCRTEGARLEDGRLDVRFRPDPAEWMTP